MLEVYTSGLTFQILSGRALDIGACSFRGLPLQWTSPVGEVHPAYYEPAGKGWLRSFPGGLLTTCGLDHFGAASVAGGEDRGLHGRASNLPAERVAWRGRWLGDEYEIEVTGRVRQARLFGENLTLERRLVTRLGASWLRVEDTVSNEGFREQPHMLLYHCNLGFPLVQAGAELHLDSRETVAVDAKAEAGLGIWSQVDEPAAGYSEQVFRHRPLVQADGSAVARLLSPRSKLALDLRFSAESLPYLYQWKMLGQGEYVLGLEPANCPGLAGSAAAQARGDVPLLAPGEQRSYSLTFELEEA